MYAIRLQICFHLFLYCTCSVIIMPTYNCNIAIFIFIISKEDDYDTSIKSFYNFITDFACSLN